MDLPSLRIVITPRPASEAPTYTIAWAEEGSQRQDFLSGSIQALGPASFKPSELGLIKICAWLAAVAWEGEGTDSSLGMALIRLDERADLPMELTKSVKLAIVEVSDGKGKSWELEWPYGYDMDELLGLGSAEHLARRMKQTLPDGKPRTKPRL